jgi:enoyl-CoA hydratase/carnithine racemase
VTDPEEKPLLVEVRDRRMILTLNRPDALNAHDDPMRIALFEAYERFDADDDLGVLILKGAGRAFSAGADLKERAPDPAELTPWELESRRRLGGYHFERLEHVRKPTIACMHGYAVGGGLEMALCCDIRLATVDARLGTPEARTWGGVPAIATHRLARLIPAGEAMRILLSSQPMSAERAYQIGLVQELAEDVDDMARIADQLADEILECSPSAIVSIKRVARWQLDSATAHSEFFSDHARGAVPSRADKTAGAEFLARRRKGT